MKKLQKLVLALSIFSVSFAVVENSSATIPPCPLGHEVKCAEVDNIVVLGPKPKPMPIILE